MKLLSREQIIDIVNKITNDTNLTEQEIDSEIEKLNKGVIDPQISDYIFFDDLTPEEIADKALSYKPICL